MRENVIRDVVTRLMTDPAFVQEVQQTPGRALSQYDLTDDELAAISANDSGQWGLGRLENRISAATARPIFGSDDIDGCGCCNVSPAKCPPCP